MKRLPFILTLAFLMILAITFIAYHYYLKKESASIWHIIPSHSVMVYEAGECSSCIEQLQASPFWEVVNSSFEFSNADDSISKIITGLFNPKSNALVSLHVTKKDEFDFVFYLQKSRAQEIELDLLKLSGEKLKFNKREFNGFKINELSLSNRLFSWTFVEEYWIGSFTSILVEDVIRTYKLEGKESFGHQSREVLQLPQIKNDAGNIYLNLNEVPRFFSLFLAKNYNLPDLGGVALLDVKQGEKNITLNGFSLTHGNQLLAKFANQLPVLFSSKQYISNRAVAITNFGVSDGSALFHNLDISTNRSVQDSIRDLSRVDLESLYSGLGKEITLCFFEARGDNLSRVLLFDSNNTKDWLKFFDLLSKASERKDSLYFEKYSGYEIREIEIRNLPDKLFKPLVSGFDQTYYTHINNFIIIGNRVEELRRFLDDIDKEDVLGKSIAFNQFLETTLLESNVSFYINTSRAWGVLTNRFNPKWKKIYTSGNTKGVALMGFSAFQFSRLHDSFYTNFTWSYDVESHTQPLQTAGRRIQSNIESEFISEPYIIRNHATKKEEFVVQDSLYFIHYFTDDGKQQWKKDIGGVIMGDLYQVDFLNNNKLQLFFLANNKFHVIDRLGNYVNPFPLPVSVQNIEYVSLVDYDNSKRYRYLLTDRSGKLWLYDKEGKNLEGWKPKNVEGALFTKPNHHRIRGKDFIVAIRKDGWVYVMNRRSENVNGFPLQLDVKPEGTYFLEPGNSMATTYFVVVSKDGIKVKFNVEGKVVSREVLIKAAIDDQFSLVQEITGKSYLIKRQNSKQLTLLNENGEPFLTNDFVSTNNVKIQYYEFGGGRNYVLIADNDQGLCYVYNSQFNLITTTPVESTGAALKYEAGKVLLVYVNEKTLVLESIAE